MDDTFPSSPTSGEPRHAAETGVSRRWFVVGGGVLVLAGAAAGSAVRIARDDYAPAHVPNPPPTALVAAAARERGLIADLDATTGGSAAVRTVIAHTRADHAAHLHALEQLLARYDAPTSTTSTGATVLNASTGAVVTGTARTVAQLRAAESRAAAEYAADAERSSGQTATLLASISAAETSHAAVLS